MRAATLTPVQALFSSAGFKLVADEATDSLLIIPMTRHDHGPYRVDRYALMQYMWAIDATNPLKLARLITSMAHMGPPAWSALK